jgi:signal transduction histidine kinase
MQNILLIENDSKTIDLVLEAFNNEEYFIDFAETGMKGYQLALRNLPKVIICSKNIYEAEGNEILHRLKGESTISTIPFVFLLDKDSIKNLKKAGRFDFDFYIAKPFSGKELIKIVKLALERYSALAEKSEKMLNELRGSISFSLPHEFFTPLNGILGFSEILLKEYDNLAKEDVIQMLNYIKSDAVRLKKITENFLLFAQLEMIGKDTEKVNDLRNSYFINPNEIITSTAQQIAKNYNRDDDLILEIGNGVIRMLESYMKKLIFELIDNAFKFSGLGTAVIVNMLSNDTSVMISVFDSGRGFTKEQIDSIGAYMQFDRMTHEQQGAGLGLIISKKIVELHGGQFKIESTPNENTKVTIIFEY